MESCGSAGSKKAKEDEPPALWDPEVAQASLHGQWAGVPVERRFAVVDDPHARRVGDEALTLGKREGAFAGMQKERTFGVVLVGKGKAVGFSFDPKPDTSVRHDGDVLEVKL
jgi:hypothetical protein